MCTYYNYIFKPKGCMGHDGMTRVVVSASNVSVSSRII